MAAREQRPAPPATPPKGLGEAEALWCVPPATRKSGRLNVSATHKRVPLPRLCGVEMRGQQPSGVPAGGAFGSGRQVEGAGPAKVNRQATTTAPNVAAGALPSAKLKPTLASPFAKPADAKTAFAAQYAAVRAFACVRECERARKTTRTATLRCPLLCTDGGARLAALRMRVALT